MALITTRSGKGAPLTNAEVDANFTNLNTDKVETSDPRLSDSREWTAATVTQAEAEEGTATTRRAWTAQRVAQAIAAWWNRSSAKTKLDGIEPGAQVNTVVSVAGKTGAVSLSKADVGLGNVDNTSDVDKPISVATQAALNGLQTQVTGLASSKLDVAATSFGGNAATATKLQTARTISLSGVVSGSASFDGSANATINTSIATPVSGNWFNGIPRVGGDGVMEIGKFVDFHETSATTADFDGRLLVEGGDLFYQKNGGVPRLVYHSGNLGDAIAQTVTGESMVFPYRKTIEIAGNQNTFYPVLVHSSEHTTSRRVAVGRGYYSPHSTTLGTTHVAGLGLLINARGVGYSDWSRTVIDHYRWAYHQSVGRVQMTSIGLFVWLRGGIQYVIESENYIPTSMYGIPLGVLLTEPTTATTGEALTVSPITTPDSRWGIQINMPEVL